MTGTNYYCTGDSCRKTTPHVCVRMDKRTFFYCVHCGHRLELRPGAAARRHERRAS